MTTNEQDKSAILPFDSIWGISVKSANGVYLVDNNDETWLDFTSSANVVNIGYNHNRVKETIIKQLDKLIFAPPISFTSEADILSKKLLKLLPGKLDIILRANTGSESIEIAMKLARRYTKKIKFLSFEHSYHGHTTGAMAIGMDQYTKKDFMPLIASEVIPHPYIIGGSKNYEKNRNKTLQIIEKKFKTNNYAAFITECFMSGPGCFPLDDFFLIELRKLCDKYNVLLIIDEVLTGFGRTGKNFSFEHSGVQPDIVCMAKGLGCGYAPIAAVATSNEIAAGFDYFATFAWNPMACAVSSTVLDIYEDEDIVNNSREMGQYALKFLRDRLSGHEDVKDIRGLGLKISIEFNNDAAFERVRKTARQNRLLVGAADMPRTISMGPPLVTNKEQLTTGLEILVKAIGDRTIHN